MKQAMPIRWLEAAEARLVCQLAVEARPAPIAVAMPRPATTICRLPGLFARWRQRALPAMPRRRAA